MYVTSKNPVTTGGSRRTERVLVFPAWQEVVQQEQGPEEAPGAEETPGAVHYEESTPNPHMDGEYSFSSRRFHLQIW